MRNNAAAALREMGEAGETPLIEMLWDEDRFARETAAQALEEGSIVERLVKDMREGVDDPEASRIIRRLAEIGSTGTIIQVLSDLPDAEVKARTRGDPGGYRRSGTGAGPVASASAWREAQADDARILRPDIPGHRLLFHPLLHPPAASCRRLPGDPAMEEAGIHRGSPPPLAQRHGAAPYPGGRYRFHRGGHDALDRPQPLAALPGDGGAGGLPEGW